MSDPDKPLPFAEFDAISRLLGEVNSNPAAPSASRSPEPDSDPPPPTPFAAEDAERAIDAALAGIPDLADFRHGQPPPIPDEPPTEPETDPQHEVESPDVHEAEQASPPAVEVRHESEEAEGEFEGEGQTAEVDRADLRGRYGRLSAREVFGLINWHGDEEGAARLRDALYPELAEPAGESGSVDEVMAGFHWDDDESY